MQEITEEYLWSCIKDIEVSMPVPVKFSSGITRWLCPKGKAYGYSEFSNRGLLGPEVTMWPHRSIFALWGGNTMHYIPVPGAHCIVLLWPQEYLLYVKERRSAVVRTIEQLDGLKASAIPRLPGHPDFDTKPYPEDFGAPDVREARGAMVEAIAKWLEGPLEKIVECVVEEEKEITDDLLEVVEELIAGKRVYRQHRASDRKRRRKGG